MTKILKLLIEKLSKHISFTELLRRFEATDDCKLLLTNPKKIGYQSTLRLLLMSLLFVICSVLMFKNYIGYWWIETSSLWNQLDKTMGLLVSFFSVFLFLSGVYMFVSNLKNVLHKRWKVKDNSVFAIPVRIVKLYPENNIPSKVLLEQSNKKRYWVTPDPDYPNWTLCKDDIGVVYLRPKCEYNEAQKLIQKGYIMLRFILA